MLTLLIIGIAVFMIKVGLFSVKAAFGLVKAIFAIIGFPVVLLILFFVGLVKLSIPLLIIGLLYVFLKPLLKK